MIKSEQPEHYDAVQAGIAELDACALEGEPLAVAERFVAQSMSEAETAARLNQLVRREIGFVWRLLRRFGLAEADADDGAQQVFLVVARRLNTIQLGSERSFLFGTAVRIASRLRKNRDGRREVELNEVAERVDTAPSPEDAVDRRRARAFLDSILELMSDEVRAVFVLYEVEQLTMAEIAKGLNVPAGTVASRLRRGREIFLSRAAEIKDSFSRGDDHV